MGGFYVKGGVPGSVNDMKQILVGFPRCLFTKHRWNRKHVVDFWIFIRYDKRYLSEGLRDRKSEDISHGGRAKRKEVLAHEAGS